MLKKAQWIFIWLPLAAVLLALAVANRETVLVSWNPLSDSPSTGIEAPLFLVILFSIAVGALCGGFTVWLGQGKWRRAAKQRGQEASRLRRESEQLGRQLEAASQPRLETGTPVSSDQA